MKNYLLTVLTIFLAGASTAGAPATITLPPGASDRISTVQVLVAPDREDWTYRPGQPVTFSVGVYFDQQPLRGSEITYRLGPEKFEAPPIALRLPEGTGTIAGGTLTEPGFLRCIVETKVGGRTYRGLATAGFDPLKIEATQNQPADFDEFWRQSLAELAQIPFELQKTLIPQSSSETVAVYHVSFQTWGSGSRPSRFYGMLAEPKSAGKYPAILQVPGAGVRSYSGNLEWAARGALVLRVGIHGIPVDLPGSVYDDLRNGALDDYPSYRLDERDRYYYRRVYLGCVRANDILTAHPYWDGKTLIVQGGSQGGQLSIVTAALDPRVTGLVCHYPAFCDVTGYTKKRAGGWPHMFREESDRTPLRLSTSAYYDTVNFARRIKVPGVYSWGYNDETCPPTSMFAAYNCITAPKELILQLDMGHSASAEFSEVSRLSTWKLAGLATPRP